MNTYFENHEINKSFLTWLQAHPDSAHSIDMDRRNNFFALLLLNNVDLSENLLRQAVLDLKDWTEDYVCNFVDEMYCDYISKKDFFFVVRSLL